MQLSDDGQWMWNGTDWVPVGQPAVVQPVLPQPDLTGTTFGAPAPASISMPQMNQQQVVFVQEEKSSSRVIPWIGVGVILLSLFMPYISILGIFEISGFEMIGFMGEIAEMASDDSGSSDSDGYDEPGGDDQGLGSEEMTLLIAFFMFGLSPLVFLLSGITSGILLLMKKSTKIMGILHLSYAVIFLFFAILSPSLEDISIFSFVGFGFYLGAFSGGAFLAK
tara:strand:+ start:767 stop:1432 length:666 start_codon:yes stop_codon:yes gene_type:complete